MSSEKGSKDEVSSVAAMKYITMTWVCLKKTATPMGYPWLLPLPMDY